MNFIELDIDLVKSRYLENLWEKLGPGEADQIVERSVQRLGDLFEDRFRRRFLSHNKGNWRDIADETLKRRKVRKPYNRQPALVDSGDLLTDFMVPEFRGEHEVFFATDRIDAVAHNEGSENEVARPFAYLDDLDRRVIRRVMLEETRKQMSL